jgi:signal transduction histidine kinase
MSTVNPRQDNLLLDGPASLSAPMEDDEDFGGRVLVVDDVAANVRLLSGILKIEGFEVLSAASGPEAIAMAGSQAPDVILLDVMMPGMDGFEACERLRRVPETAHTPIVIVTALQDTTDRVRAIHAGADDFLTKPVDEVEVVARVRSLVRSKRRRDSLERVLSDLREARAMSEGLSAMLVHDLRTPLTTMLVSLDLLNTSRDTLAQWQQDVVAMSARSGQHLLGLVNQLLDVSRLETGEMPLEIGPCDAALLIEDSVSLVRTQAHNESTSIIVEIEPDLPPLQADAALIGRVLTNLLGNAVKFTRRGTPVSLCARLEGDEWIFEVRDRGEGVREEDRERIFGKFAQANARRGERHTSSGLGLFFCRLAVAAHGGRIWVDSTPGEGSTFAFALPREPTR